MYPNANNSIIKKENISIKTNKQTTKKTRGKVYESRMEKGLQ